MLSLLRERDERGGVYIKIFLNPITFAVKCFYTRINFIYLRPQAICLLINANVSELCHLYYVNLFENHNFSRMWILNL